MASLNISTPDSIVLEARRQLRPIVLAAVGEDLSNNEFVEILHSDFRDALEETLARLQKAHPMLSRDDVRRSAQMVADAVTRAGELELLHRDEDQIDTVPDGAPIMDDPAPAPTAREMMNALWRMIKTAVQLQHVENDRLAKRAAVDKNSDDDRKDRRLRDAQKRMREQFRHVYARPR